MSSLKNRILVSFTVSLIIFLIIFAVTVYLGFNLSLQDWNRANEERIIDTITKKLEKQYRNGNTGSRTISELLSPYLKNNMEITVFSPEGRILFSHNSSIDKEQEYYNKHFMMRIKENFSMMQGRGDMHHNENMMPPVYREDFQNNAPPPVMNIMPGPDMPENRRNIIPPPDDFQNRDSSFQIPERRNNQRIGQYMRKKIEEAFPGQALIRPVIADRRITAFVKVKSLRLKFYDRVNRKFINSIIITVIGGTFAAFLIAVSSSWFISKKLSRDAASLSEGLNSLAGGKRNVVFPGKGSEEILSISESASILQEELIHDEERRKQWAQDIAHDLRTPITAVKSQIEALKDGVFKPGTERFLKLLKELARLENLVEDMNSLSKIETSKSILKTKSVNSQDIKGILKERFDIIAEEKAVNLSITADQFSLSCDLNLLIRALSNLVQNSIKYSESGTAVEVNIARKDENAVFTVKNPGHIGENEIEKIFDRLYRGESGRSSEGSGLGLTIAAAVIKQHNGIIKAENINENILFTATIPLEQTF